MILNREWEQNQENKVAETTCKIQIGFYKKSFRDSPRLPESVMKLLNNILIDLSRHVEQFVWETQQFSFS